MCVCFTNALLCASVCLSICLSVCLSVCLCAARREANDGGGAGRRRRGMRVRPCSDSARRTSVSIPRKPPQNLRKGVGYVHDDDVVGAMRSVHDEIYSVCVPHNLTWSPGSKVEAEELEATEEDEEDGENDE